LRLILVAEEIEKKKKKKRKGRKEEKEKKVKKKILNMVLINQLTA
jgi:uncharacterized protein YvpB